jgi:hypothetical protein
MRRRETGKESRWVDGIAVENISVFGTTASIAKGSGVVSADFQRRMGSCKTKIPSAKSQINPKLQIPMSGTKANWFSREERGKTEGKAEGRHGG